MLKAKEWIDIAQSLSDTQLFFDDYAIETGLYTEISHKIRYFHV